MFDVVMMFVMSRLRGGHDVLSCQDLEGRKEENRMENRHKWVC
jgi:hypothetical protein